MKNISFFIIVLVSASLFSCEDKVHKPDSWPEWPSRPLVENALLRGVNNETSVVAGDKVVFSAYVSDEYNDLLSYQLEFKSNGVVIAEKYGELSGASADISFETLLPFGAYYEEGVFYPEVLLKVTNILNVTTEFRLSNEQNVSVSRPETPAQLYIVDNNGATYPLTKVGESYKFQTSGSLSAIGSSFKIAEKLSENQIDYSGLVWGYVNGNIIIVDNSSGNMIPTPETDGYGIKHMSFSVYSFELSKTLDVLIEINKSEMTSAIKGGIDYLIKEPLSLIQDAQVKFTGFDQDLNTMLRPDLFTDIDGDTARFTGSTRIWRAFYNTANKFMYVHTNNNEDNLLWFAGTGGGFPLPPYVATSDWFGTEPHGYFSFKRYGTNLYEMLIYLNTNMAFQLYRRVEWGSVLTSITSLSPSLLTVNPNGDITPGAEFEPGVYNLKVDVEGKTVELIPYKQAAIF